MTDWVAYFLADAAEKERKRNEIMNPDLIHLTKDQLQQLSSKSYKEGFLHAIDCVRQAANLEDNTPEVKLSFTLFADTLENTFK